MILICCRWGKPIAVCCRCRQNKQHARRRQQKQTQTNRAASWRHRIPSWVQFYIQRRGTWQEIKHVWILREEKKRDRWDDIQLQQKACGAEASNHQSHTTSVSMAFLKPFNETWEWHYVTNRDACPAGVAHLLHSSGARKTKTKRRAARSASYFPKRQRFPLTLVQPFLCTMQSL